MQDGTQDWQELMNWVGFGLEDEVRLQNLLLLVEPELVRITDRFYEAIQRSAAVSVLQDEAQVIRLKGTLRVWIREMLAGPHGEAYWERRRRIGQTHVRVGLAHRYVFPAMDLIRRDLIQIAIKNFGPEGAILYCHSLSQIIDIELAIMSSTYMAAHEHVQLRSLQDLIIGNMPVTILCIGDDGRVTAATRPSSRLFGSSAEVGRRYEDFLPADLIEAADLPSLLGRALATDETIDIPRILVGSGAEARQFRLVVVPLRHELARLLLHIEEVTEVVRAESRAQQAESLARIGTLAANIAHEIRNPLTAISTTLQVISGTLPAEDRRRQILGKVGEQVQRLDRLVSDLLGYARKATPRLRAVCPAEIAQEAISIAGVNAAVEGDSPPVTADDQFLTHILVNLLQNARDADPAQPLRLQLSPGSIAVIDSGPGVPAHILPRLFEPFHTTKTRGTGLGLAISRKLAESMDGRLIHRLPSPPPAPGPGACFEIILPLAHV